MSLFTYLEMIEDERRMAQCIFGDPDRAPSISTLNLIERNHICEKCGGSVAYVQDKDGGVRDYHFECKTDNCDWQGKEAPLKKINKKC